MRARRATAAATRVAAARDEDGRGLEDATRVASRATATRDDDGRVVGMEAIGARGVERRGDGGARESDARGGN